MNVALLFRDRHSSRSLFFSLPPVAALRVLYKSRARSPYTRNYVRNCRHLALARLASRARERLTKCSSFAARHLGYQLLRRALRARRMSNDAINPPLVVIRALISGLRLEDLWLHFALRDSLARSFACIIDHVKRFPSKYLFISARDSTCGRERERARSVYLFIELPALPSAYLTLTTITTSLRRRIQGIAAGTLDRRSPKPRNHVTLSVAELQLSRPGRQ